MQITPSGRVVFIGQWIAAVVLPLFLFFGRALVGAEIGWLFVLGIIYGIFLILLLLVPPLLTVFDREVRTAKSTRTAYSVTTYVLWGALVLGSLTIPDAGDSGNVRPALTVWTGDAVSIETASTIFGAAATVIGLAYTAAFVLAIVGIVRGSSAPR